MWSQSEHSLATHRSHILMYLNSYMLCGRMEVASLISWLVVIGAFLLLSSLVQTWLILVTTSELASEWYLLHNWKGVVLKS